MSIKDDLTKDITIALKAGEKDKLSALRLLLSSLKYKAIEARRELEDAEVHALIQTLIRQRNESIEQFKQGARLDLVEKEEKEIVFLKAYLPVQLSADEIREIVKNAAVSTGAKGPADMGKIMKVVMPQTKGKADGKLVNEIVKEVLGS